MYRTLGLIFASLLTISTLVAVYLCKPLARVFGKERLRYPPGPKALPMLGNLFNMPIFTPWLTYQNWSKQYGDVIHVGALGNHFIIVNSLETASELLAKRASIYSGRPHMTMLGELMGWDVATGLADYGPVWKKHRRAFHQHFQSNAMVNYRELQQRETCKLLLNLLDSPDHFKQHVKHWMAAILLNATYGIEAKDENDPYMAVLDIGMEGVSEAGIPGRFLVDVFPLLKYVPAWFPGAGFKVLAEHWREAGRATRDIPFEKTKSELRSGRKSASFAGYCLNEIRDGTIPEDDEDIIKEAAGSTYSAGSETTITPLSLLFAVMALHPEIQRKAQAELDNHLGHERLPDFADKASLPYVEAIAKELLRWQPSIPFALPHKLASDDSYRGYHIPKGAMVSANIWAMSRDEKYYANPDTFNPDRFLKDGTIDSNALDPSRFVFGFGYRICPGRYFAMNTLFIAVASVLACFRIKYAKDEDGHSIPIDLKMSPTFTSFPEPFKCSIKPRFEVVPEVVQRTMEGLH